MGYKIKTPSGMSSFLWVVNQSGKMASGALDSLRTNSMTLMPLFWRVFLKLSNSFWAYKKVSVRYGLKKYYSIEIGSFLIKSALSRIFRTSNI